MIIKNREKRGMTLVEVMVAAAIVSLVMTVLIHIIRQGSDTINSSTWYKNNLTRLQIGLTRIAEDMYKASNDRKYVVDPATSLEEVKEIPYPFTYIKGDKFGQILDPDSDKIVKALVISGGADSKDDSEKVIFKFLINHLGTRRLGKNDPTYSFLVTATLKKGVLYYEKKWYGTPPTTKVDDVEFPKNKIIENIDYIYISHQNNVSTLDPTIIEDSVVRIFIKLKDLNAAKNRAKIRSLSLKKSIHINVESKMVSNL